MSFLFSVPSNYQAGTTIFSTINQHGQIGDFSSQLPTHVGQGTGTIPVIVLRVLPAQLSSSHLYPRLPQSNTFAPLVNSLDIKSLLSNYFSKMNVVPAYSVSKYSSNPGYQESSYITDEQYYSQPSHTYQEQTQYNDGDAYDMYRGQTPATQIYKSQTYEPQAYKSSFDIVKSLEQQPELYKLNTQYQTNQYLPANTQTSALLTHENYPSKSHTRVIFKTPEGK